MAGLTPGQVAVLDGMDGSRSLAALHDVAAAHGDPPERVLELIGELRDRRLLVDPGAERAERLTAWRRARHTVAVSSPEPLGESLARALTRAGVGHVLPIMKNAHDQWQSGPWFLRSEHCYLVPGDSPLGYRLPLDSQPWAAKSDHPYVNPPDPEMAQAPLASHADYRAAASGRKPAHAQMRVPGPALGQGHPWDKPGDTLPGFKESAAWITRLAMCAEPRDGKLYIFMPPTSKLEDYLEVVAAVEATAEEMQLPVILEGYEPPSDPRLNISASRRTPASSRSTSTRPSPGRNWSSRPPTSTNRPTTRA